MALSIVRQLLFLIMVLCCFSCAKNDTALPSNRTVNIDPIFQPYIAIYIKEAAARGVSVAIEEKGLTVVFQDLDGGFNGRCHDFNDLLQDTTRAHEIHIDREKWNNELTDAYKEFLIFHEMGHCYEYRSHTTDTLPNGEWKSLMRDGRPPFGNSTLNFSGT
jgi:hypothetical protein